MLTIYMLLAAGAYVGSRIVYRGVVDSKELLNPTFAGGNVGLFATHLALCLWVTFVSGPTSITNESKMMYWTGVSAVWLLSIPVVILHNRTIQSYGSLVGRFGIARNIFDFALFAWSFWVDADFDFIGRLHCFVWFYRLMDVGPRRLLINYPTVNFLTVVSMYAGWGVFVATLQSPMYIPVLFSTPVWLHYTVIGVLAWGHLMSDSVQIAIAKWVPPSSTDASKESV
jgi:hypothetical protein